MIGNPASNQSEPRFLLDESLTPAVAEALNLVGYNFTTTAAGLGRGALDPEIIAWCRDNGATWVHADGRAYRQHRNRLQTSGIRTLWLQRPGGRMTGKEQLRILSFVLPMLPERWEGRRAGRHYRATATNPTATPSLRPVDV